MNDVPKLLVLLLVCLLLVSTAAASSPSLSECEPSAGGSIFQPSSSCVLDVTALEQAQLRVLGGNGHRLPTVQTRGKGLKGVKSVYLNSVILASTDSFPNHAIDLATLLRPPLAADSDATVNLTNVMLLHTLSPSQAAVAVSTLRGVVSDPIVQRAVSSWQLQLYTDYVSFVYIGSYSVPGLVCNGCGVFLRFSRSSSSSGSGGGSADDQPTTTPDEARPAVNYLLNADNATFVPALMRYTSISSPRPFLVLLASNITWARHPALLHSPDGFMVINRPVTIVGQHNSVTALDLGMIPNAVHLTGSYSNVTFHGVVLENHAFGDRKSGSQPAGLSVMNPFNLWIFFWPRLDMRLLTVNTTMVAPHQEAVQYLVYWQVMLSSSDPGTQAAAAWLQRGPGVTIWEAVVYPDRLLDVKFVCRTSIARFTWRTSAPVVFRQLPDNVDDPTLYQTGLKVHSAAPLATLAGSGQQLQSWLTSLSGLPREGFSMLVAPQVQLGVGDDSSWPPGGNIVLKAPKTVMVGQRVCESPPSSSSSSSLVAAGSSTSVGGSSRSSSSSGGGASVNSGKATATQMPQRRLLESMGVSPADAAAAVRCTNGNNATTSTGTSSGDSSSSSSSSDSGGSALLSRVAHYPILDLAQDTSLLQLQPAGASGVLEFNSLTLVGLSQGPAVGANAIDDPSALGRRLAAVAAAAVGSSSTAVGRLAPGSSSSMAHGSHLPSSSSGWRRWQLQAQQRSSHPCHYHHHHQQEQQQHPSYALRSLAAAAEEDAASSGGSSSSSGSLTQADPRVWSHLVWAVKRAANGKLVLRNTALGLPQPEFEQLLAASRASAMGGAFTIPLQGGGALSAKSSSYVDNCCLLINSYTAPGMNASQLLLFADPDAGRSMPHGYFWPYDSAAGLDAGAKGSSRAVKLSSGALAGLILGVFAAAVLAAVLLWGLVVRHRRRRASAVAAAAAAAEHEAKQSMYKQQVLSPGDFDGSGSRGMYGTSKDLGGFQQQQHRRRSADMGYAGDQQRGTDLRELHSHSGVHSSGSGTGTGLNMGGSGFGSDGGSGSATGNQRWHKLTTAISSKVQDIHEQRLRTAFLQAERTGMVALGRSLASPSPIHGNGGSSCSYSSAAGTPQHGGAAAAAAAAAAGVAFVAAGEQHEQQEEDAEVEDNRNHLELKELIGRGTFGTAYRASWQGANVAVKLLQLPPGAGRNMTETGMFSGGGSEAGTAGLLRAVSGWGNAAAGGGAGGGPGDGRDERTRDLMKHEHMAVQEAAIGSCMMHPNIVSVYSISLRPSHLPTQTAAPKPSSAAPGVLLLRDDGTTVMGTTDLMAGYPKRSAASLELLPIELQLIMELCDQGTLREALDAGLLVNQASGLHDLAIVLSLAHNVACAMAYLHQEHIIHGDLKASNVLLKTAVPAAYTDSSSNAQPGRNATTLQQQQQQVVDAAAAAHNTGSWSVKGRGQLPGGGSSSSSSGQAPSVGATSGYSSSSNEPGHTQAQGSGRPQASGAQGLTPTPPSTAQQQGLVAAAEQNPAASLAIMGAAAAVADEQTSGVHSLLKCGWVVAKVSDFGLSMAVKPEETHVSSVHAGTLTHMAPEMLMHGRCSKASDVYAFGILLWEVATGGKAFAGIPKPLLGHCIISQGIRPTWPAALRPSSSSTRSSSNAGSSSTTTTTTNGASGGTRGGPHAGGAGGGIANGPWAELVALTERCWSQEPQARPTFAEVVQQLARLLKGATASQAGTTAPLPPPVAAAALAAGAPQPAAQAAAAAAAGATPSIQPAFCPSLADGGGGGNSTTPPVESKPATGGAGPAAAAAAAGMGMSNSPGCEPWLFAGLSTGGAGGGSIGANSSAGVMEPGEAVMNVVPMYSTTSAGQQQQQP